MAALPLPREAADSRRPAVWARCSGGSERGLGPRTPAVIRAGGGSSGGAAVRSPRFESERPALAALVELDVAEALAPSRLAQAQVELPDVVVAPELVGWTVEDDPTVLHDVAVVG